MAATYHDIQRLTGLSLSTISKYFNGGSVRPATEAAISEAAQALNFRVNDFARGLKSKKSRSIGLLIPELDSTFHTTIMRHISETLRMRGYSCIVVDCNADRQVELDAMGFLLDKMVDGVITIPYDKSGAPLKLAMDRDIPVVLVDRLIPGFKADAVILDNQRAGALAAGHLLSHGHRRIGMVSGPAGIYTMQHRRQGFCDALKAAGALNEYLVTDAEFSVEGGYRAALELLSNHSRPTALFCANYELTLGAIIAMNELGLRWPDDLSLLGFDNLVLARVLKPALTTIAQPMEQMAATAAALMLDRLEQGPAPGTHTIELAPTLVQGASVAHI